MRLATWLHYLRVMSIVDLVRLECLRRARRFRAMRWQFLGKPLLVVDSASAYSSLRSIFLDREYAFVTDKDEPRIIDVGANIGISVIYFKLQHPRCHVTAFEADPTIFTTLQQNVEAFGLDKVTLVNKAAWVRDGEVDFAADGADGGAMARAGDATRSVRVPATRLRDHLTGPVDLLKIDIEGAETEVLEDCRGHLGDVRRIFVEYHSLVGRPQTLHRLLTVLAEAGFRVTVIPTTTISLQPFLRRPVNHGMDLQLNVFATRESA